MKHIICLNFISFAGTSVSCELCGKVFSRKDLVRFHIDSTHLKLKPFKCSICGQVFSHPSSRSRHLKRCRASLMNKYLKWLTWVENCELNCWLLKRTKEIILNLRFNSLCYYYVNYQSCSWLYQTSYYSTSILFQSPEVQYTELRLIE